MGVRWWTVTAAGVVCLLVCLALAALSPMSPLRRRMHPLAHTSRLTGLPEYARVIRRQRWTTIATVALLIVVFLAALLTGSRPLGSVAATRSGDAAPEDIMLCVGAPLTDPVTAGFLNYFAHQARTYDTQRIGLTSTTLRVVPLTLDHGFAADRFTRLATLAAAQQSVDTRPPGSAVDPVALAAEVDAFSRAPTYADYAPSVQDVLALCMAGFPARNDVRRSVIYVGDSTIRVADEARPSLFSTPQVKDLASRAGIQINVIARSKRADPALRGVSDLHSIAAATGGSFEIYNSVGTSVDTAGGTNPTLAATLNGIRADPPPAKLTGADGAPVTTVSAEDPTLALIVAVACLLAQSATVVVTRR